MKYYARLIVLFCFIVTLFATLSSAMAAPVTVRIDPTVVISPNGQTFDVNVVLDDVDNLGGFEFDIYYPETVVNIIGNCSVTTSTSCGSDTDCPATQACVYPSAVVLGPCLASTGRSPIPVGPVVDNNTGTLSYGAGSVGVPDGFVGSNCVLATITFTGVAQGSGTLNLNSSQVVNIPDPITVGAEIDATVDICVNAANQIRILDTPPVYYSTIQLATDATVSGDIIQTRGVTFGGNVDFDQSGQITLRGGYNCSFTDNPGYTSIDGALTFDGGPVTLDRIIIK